MLGMTAALCAALAMAGAVAQDTDTTAPDGAASAIPMAIVAGDAQRSIAAGSVLVLETLEPLNSTPGELLVAARYLEVGGQRIPLRAFRLGVTGKDNTNLALGVSFAAGPFAHFIRGREIEIPAHTRGEARVAQDTEWMPATAAAAQELPAPTSTATNPSTTTPSE